MRRWRPLSSATQSGRARSHSGDDEVDELYQRIYHELISFIVRDPSTIEQANLLMWAAHNLERTADRVTNLCERVVYTVTGELEELDSDTAGVESF
jgi:phosphate transport system protein